MSRFVIILIGGAALACGLQDPAHADILVDHLPHPYGGPSSDTSFYTPLGQPYWQRLADDFMLSSADQATNLKWYGFYDADNPPAQETMRVRFYDARRSDGLPGLVLYEETFQNPSRIATGRIILTGVGPHEYLYQASFSSPVSLQAATTYWLEVVQIGDISTSFRWEDSVSDFNGIAFVNPAVPDWESSIPGAPADVAFQLLSPEPATLTVLVLGFFLLARERESGGRRASGYDLGSTASLLIS